MEKHNREHVEQPQERSRSLPAPPGSSEAARCLTPMAVSRETAIPPHSERRFRAKPAPCAPSGHVPHAAAHHILERSPGMRDDLSRQIQERFGFSPNRYYQRLNR
ncbi:hypothetical protein ACWEVT_33475, partial [Saccharopolyspora sp. NPDC003762]